MSDVVITSNISIKVNAAVSANYSGVSGAPVTVWQNNISNGYAVISVYAGGGASTFSLYLADAAGQAVSAASSFIIASNTTRSFADNIYVPAGKYLLLFADTPTAGFAKVVGVQFINSP